MPVSDRVCVSVMLPKPVTKAASGLRSRRTERKNEIGELGRKQWCSGGWQKSNFSLSHPLSYGEQSHMIQKCLVDFVLFEGWITPENSGGWRVLHSEGTQPVIETLWGRRTDKITHLRCTLCFFTINAIFFLSADLVWKIVLSVWYSLSVQ